MKYNFHKSSLKDAHTLILLNGIEGADAELLKVARDLGDLNILVIEGEDLENGRSHYFQKAAAGLIDEESIREKTEELHFFIKGFIEGNELSMNKLIMLGYSEGATITGAVLMLYPELLEAAILLRPMQPLNDQEFKASRHSKVYFAYGKKDHTLTEPETLTWAEILKIAGYSVEIHALDTGHELISKDFSLLISWFSDSFKK